MNSKLKCILNSWFPSYENEHFICQINIEPNLKELEEFIYKRSKTLNLCLNSILAIIYVIFLNSLRHANIVSESNLSPTVLQMMMVIELYCTVGKESPIMLTTILFD